MTESGNALCRWRHFERERILHGRNKERDMYKINDNYQKLPGSYLFSTIAKKVNAYSEANPDKKIIRLGIGDVTQPIAPAIIEAMHKAVDEMGHAETFH